MTENKPTVIKRYQNRKLYDTRNSTYVTLEEIAKMIRDGEEIQIIDNRTKEDLTELTMTQIIFELGKKRSPLIPLEALVSIIKNGGMTLGGFFEKKLDQSMHSIHKAKEWPEKVFDRFKEDENKLIQGVLTKTQGFSKKIDETIKSTVDTVKSHSTQSQEVKQLLQKIEQLEKKIRKYEG